MILMKARFSLIWVAVLTCEMLFAQVHIQVSDPATWDPETLRPYIGQTVIFDVPMVVNNNYSGLLISTRRFFSPTNQVRPGSSMVNNIMTLNDEGGIYLNNAPIAEGDAYYRLGEKIYNLKAKVNSTSSLTWIDGEWKGNTRNDLLNADIRAMVNIDDCDECMLVCTMNLEYYIVENIGGSMGPKDLNAHKRQRAKTSKALAKINADIYGFVEIEQGQKAAAEIATDLNTNLPDRNYTYINDGGSSSGTYTKSAFVYDRNKVKPIGVIQEKEGGSIPAERHRMICFEEIATGERFIFSVNHFKAKGSGGYGLDSNENDNGQGGFNQTRQEEARPVPLPAAAGGEETENRQTGKLVISIGEDGVLYVGSRIVPPAGLKELLLREKGESALPLEVRVRADRNLPWSAAEPILLICAEAGISNLSFSVLPK